jgi:starch phosphorylase
MLEAGMKILSLTVKPNIPERLHPLEEMAYNFWTSWNFEAIMLFMRLDYDLWLSSRQNPVRVLGSMPQERLEEIARDDSFLAAMDAVYFQFRKYLSGESWYKGERQNAVAYFSMEYGLDVHLPVYSGGLGVLSGDHLKASSDLGLPLVGVGLLYRQGYFRQYLNPDGFQLESYPENDWYNMPVRQCLDAQGHPVKIGVDMGDSVVIAQIWETRVGRIALYLLDTNIPENAPEHQAITATLYPGDRDVRIRQEILLGMGGIRALKAVGANPVAIHMNEGHSAFLGIERIRILMHEQGLTFDDAQQAIWPTSIFTTHTPVPAGNERFAIPLMHKYFGRIAQELGLSWKDFLALGRENPQDDQEPFCMTVLALRLSAYANGVSRMHQRVSQHLWRKLWPELPEEEIPITSITNGVHPRTWISHDMQDLLDRYFGPRFREDPTYLDIWKRIERVSDEELWRTHERRRERLVAFGRDRLKQQLIRRGAVSSELTVAEDVLSPYALTISFARRFATYKRGNLLMRDPDRLIRLLADNGRPIQLIFAGKAHPHDLEGKEMIKEIVHFASRPEVRSRVVFLEDYDITIARYLVSGSDLWLNTPRRPLEASGTSGMKAAMNGVLNISVLDGWWAEGYRPEVGWAIGRGEEYDDLELQDEVESKAVYDLLEREIIPLFYTRGRDGLPREWIRRMKASMSRVGSQFNSHRMLLEYSSRFSRERYSWARELAAYMQKLRAAWDRIRITRITLPDGAFLKVGDRITPNASIDLGGLSPEDVQVELYYGLLSAQGGIVQPQRQEMLPAGQRDGVTEYAAEIRCSDSGRQGYTVRVLPRHLHLVHPFIPHLIRWG